MSAGLILYNALAALAFLLSWPFLLAACLCGREGKWRGRCGAVPRTKARPLWLHASSVGEVNAIAPLVAGLRKHAPGSAIALSTMTATGQRRARESFGDAVTTFFFPLDFFWIQASALRRLDPALV
ncbi:MAG TPA: glycosyltransferase N-terminal domain-containing protein, partial [Candidatus Edwardsbacteria bacterium]|nr:glycosyltransferase N-terminal domain-containing protein [Candidatus Edwardsbacteria bacterium]